MSAARFRSAAAGDAQALAALHADSWRRHYRGAFSDAFLDGDVLSDRLAVWVQRLERPESEAATILAEQDGRLVGFAHVILDEDRRWGSLLDNIHVIHTRKRTGIGARLFARVAAKAGEARPSSGLYLWALEQNTAAQAFYEALGGARVERRLTEPPGGVPGRLEGSPYKLRYAWEADALNVVARSHRWAG